MNIQYPDVTFVGPPADDLQTLERLPPQLASALKQTNGFVAFSGGFHLRGACSEPDWHALRLAWEGERSFRRLYPGILETDVPFAENALGDQYLLRGDLVWRLSAETGELESTSFDLIGFTEAVARDPVETLQLHPLLRFRKEGGQLAPGQLLSVYPPFFAAESAAGVSLRAVNAISVRETLAYVAGQIASLPDGAKIVLKVVE